jgi:hypothetical protein
LHDLELGFDRTVRVRPRKILSRIFAKSAASIATLVSPKRSGLGMRNNPRSRRLYEMRNPVRS